MREKIIETRTCRQCSTPFTITDRDIAFYEKVSPVFAGKKELIPPPTLCPECRQQRRLAFRNERKLYRRKCDVTGKEIISIYSSDKPYKVYGQKEWWGDGWDAMKYGRDFDFGQTFTRQYSTLMHDVPCMALYVLDSMINSDFCNFGYDCKNCYLSTNSYRCEDAFYSHTGIDTSWDVDGYVNDRCQHTYMSQFLTTCTDVFYSLHCQSCQDCWYCRDCIECTHCIGCVNMVHQEYSVMNKSVGRDEYTAILQKIHQGDKKLIYTLQEFQKTSIVKSAHFLSSQDCTGDEIQNSQQVNESYEIVSTERAKYITLS